jgi:uncharacterized coiled-coil DUF342 family protein
MNQIDKLKKEIEEIEQSVDSESSKADLYDTLVVAYFKAKDIIELYSGVNPVNDVSKDSNKASEELTAAEATIESLKEELASKANHLQSEIASNTAACLERDKALNTITEIAKLVNGK